MHYDDLLAVVNRRPFVPFRLHLSHGASYEVRDPAAILVARGTATVALPDYPRRPAERVVTVALIHVCRLEELPAPADS
jgi:hypothetical protein